MVDSVISEEQYWRDFHNGRDLSFYGDILTVNSWEIDGATASEILAGDDIVSYSRMDDKCTLTNTKK